jgi:membrane protease YdiL (CAAX protease family)
MYIYLSYEKEKLSVLEKTTRLVAMYRSWSLQLWLPSMLLMLIVNQTQISLSDLGLQWQWDLANIISSAGLLAICGYFLFSLNQLKNNTQQHQAIRKQLGYIQWMTPSTAREARYFILGLSISAGICEEILFRGYLMQALGNYLPTYAVVIISSITFGLAHIYQGAIHIVRTSIVGATMALIYLYTDSIIIPILLHVAIDMYAGAMAYIVFSSKQVIDENRSKQLKSS